LLGNQMSFDFDADELLAVVPMSMDEQEDNIAWDAVEDGILKMSYNNNDGLTVVKGDVLVEFLFKGTEVTLANNSKLQPELYTEEDGQVMTQAIKFVSSDNSSVAVLSVDQNKPNPFKDQTVIGFTLVQSGNVIFSLTDASGRLIRQEQKHYETGYNQINLSADDLGAHGVVYYQLSSGNQTVTRKMIVLK